MKRIYPLALLLCLTIASCKQKSAESSTSNPYPQALKFDSVRVADSLKTKVAGEEARADYSIVMDYPMDGDSAQVKWLRQWLALEVAGLNDSLPASAAHVSQEYAKAKSGYQGKLDDPKALATFGKDKLFADFKNEVVKPASFAMSYSEDVSIRVAYHDHNVVTYLRSGYSYRGGAHGMPITVYTVFDLNKKTTLTNADIFVPAKINKVKQIIARGLCTYFKVKDFNGLKDNLLSFPNEITSVNELPLPQCTVGLTPAGIVFVYQNYEIACYAAGQPTATVSYKDLWDCLTPDVQKMLDEVNTKVSK